jgi:hypothetical protein
MKTLGLPILALCAISISISGAVYGQAPGLRPEAPGATREAGRKSPSGVESRLLQHLLSMDAKELANLRQTVERIEKMSPADRDKMRRRMKDMDAMEPGKVEAMRQYYQSIPKETREAMRRNWDAMSTEERADWRRRLRDLSPAERLRVFQEEGFLPGGRPRQKPSDSPSGKKPATPPVDR